ncbi:MAG: 4'-phosphopantetheinyl transferase family protein [Anaerolineae bacterium]
MPASWHSPPPCLALNRDEVHVWRVPLDVPPGIVAGLFPLLSAGEQTRAEQLRAEDASRRFVASHGALRIILARYLGDKPERLRFLADAWGKPRLDPPARTSPLRFSLSHSGELALCAVTEGRDVGVDLEQIRAVSAWREIAARYFSPDEQSVLRALTGDRALQTFFHGWTRKEAYSKALGDGVSQAWAQYSVSLAPRAVTELTGAGPRAEQGRRFTLCPLELEPGYVAAVAAQGAGWSLRCWHWSWATEGAARIA